MLVLYLTDLDECAKNDTCAANEVCVNTVGNYTCSCAPGYRGEAGSCQGNCLSFFCCCCCGCFLFVCVCVCVCVCVIFFALNYFYSLAIAPIFFKLRVHVIWCRVGDGQFGRG